MATNNSFLAADISGGNTTVQELSRREYDSRVAVPRLLKLLEEYSIPVTFFIPAVTAQLHPEAVEAILRSPLRHEVAVYGWFQEPIIKLPADEERRLTKKAFDFWTERLGHKPAGIRTINWNYTDATASIIRDLGFLYDSSLMADDRPYEVTENSRPTGIIEIPVENITDDWAYYGLGAGSFTMGDSEVLEIHEREFDGAYKEGTLFQATMHPFLMAHRSRLVMLEQLLAHMKSKPGVWFATHEQVALAAKAQMR